MYESFLRAPCERFNPSSTVVSARASAADDVVSDVFIAPADEFVVDDANVRTPSTPRPRGSVVPIDAIGVAAAPTRVHADVDATEHVGENARDIAPRETSSALARASVHPLRALEKANRPMMSSRTHPHPPRRPSTASGEGPEARESGEPARTILPRVDAPHRAVV